MEDQWSKSVELPDPGLEPYGEVDEEVDLNAASDEAQDDVVEIEEQP